MTLNVMIGCDNTPTEVEDYNPEPYLTAFMVNGEPVDEIWLERIAPLDVYYRPEDYGIRNAAIKIFEIDGIDTLHFQDDPQQIGSGHYIPAAGESLIPRSLGHYRIEARTPQGEFLWAESHMPAELDSVAIFLLDDDGSFTPVSEGDTLNRDMPNLYWAWTPVDSAGGYQGLITALLPKSELVGLDPDWRPVETPEDTAYCSRSGWMVMRWDQTQITLPWLYFEWQGPTRVELFAVNGQYYDYLFSLYMIDSGQVNRPQYNVHGGLGVFGLISKYAMNIYMQRVEYD